MEVYTSTLGCCSGRNFGRNSVEIRSKVGKAQKETKKNNTQLGVCTSLADSYSSPQATTDHENRGSLLMGCVWASGEPDSSLEAARSDLRGAFVSSNFASQQHKQPRKIAKCFPSRAGSYCSIMAALHRR